MIFIVGCPRSGTSLIAKILLRHGCEGGDVDELFENHRVRDKIVKRYLVSIGADPLGQYPLPRRYGFPVNSKLRLEMARFIPMREPWFYKDPKLTLVWPEWHRAFPKACWIVVRRDKRAIVSSWLRSGFWRRDVDWDAWVYEYEARLEDLSRTVRAVQVWPGTVIRQNESFAPVARFCNLRFNRQAVESSIDHGLWQGEGS